RWTDRVELREGLLYQTSQTLTHWRHRLSGPKRRYLIGPTDVSATDVPEKRTQHESMSPQVGITAISACPGREAWAGVYAFPTAASWTRYIISKKPGTLMFGGTLPKSSRLPL